MQNAKLLTSYVAETVTETVSSLSDGVQLTDALVLVNAVTKMPNFKTVLPLAKQEIVAATDEEISELRKLFKTKFDLTDDKTEARVERLFNIGIETILLIEGV